MNTLEYTALHIEEDATDANEVDPNDWNARVESTADCLIDWVYGYLNVSNRLHLDRETREVIERMVAEAMIAQRDWDAEMWQQLMSDDLP
jgi:hypothetical protein